MYSWGLGESGQLGRGALPPLRKPNSDAYEVQDILQYHLTPQVIQVADNSNNVYVKTIGSGAYHSMIVVNATNNNTGERIYTCGLNNYGQLGLGKSYPSSQQVEKFTAIIDIFKEGACVGADTSTSRPFPTDACVTTVAGGVHHSVCIMHSSDSNSSNMYAWGRGDSGQLGTHINIILIGVVLKHLNTYICTYAFI